MPVRKPRGKLSESVATMGQVWKPGWGALFAAKGTRKPMAAGKPAVVRKIPAKFKSIRQRKRAGKK
ncbi:MAG TPA: hypothetical protein VI977_01915 [archaeon]|nr:hypothetical protein [archaeon]